MRRDQLEHAIRTACQVIGRHEVIVVGSHSNLGTFREDQLPADATMSTEIDILPIADDKRTEYELNAPKKLVHELRYLTAVGPIQVCIMLIHDQGVSSSP
jgi:hypothetical protein